MYARVTSLVILPVSCYLRLCFPVTLSKLTKRNKPAGETLALIKISLFILLRREKKTLFIDCHLKVNAQNNSRVDIVELSANNACAHDLRAWDYVSNIARSNLCLSINF